MNDIKTSVFEFLNRNAKQNEPIPSLRKIRTAVGGGSFSTISDAVKEWQRQSLVDSGKLPNAFQPDEIKALSDAVWQIVLPIMTSRIREISDYHSVRVNLALRTAERIRQEGLSMLEEAEEQRLQQQSKLEDASNKLQRAQTEIASLSSMLSAYRSENNELKQQLEEIRAEREKILVRLTASEAENSLLKKLFPPAPKND